MSPDGLDAARIDLNKLRSFAVIADQGGVSAAAEKLSLSRSAVSHSLAALESSLGVPLFHRVGRGLVLTPEGRTLRRAYAEAEGRIGAALESIGEETREVRGLLRLGLYPGFSRFRLAGLLDGFLAAHPAARCRMVHGTRSELQEALEAGRLDFLLSLEPREGDAARQVVSVPVFEQSLVLALRKDLRARGRGFEALADLPLVDYFRSEPLIDRWVAHHYPRNSVPPNVRVWVGAATDVALELTRRGLGACVLPADLVEPYRKEGELRVLRGPGEPLRDEIWLHQLATPRSSALHRAFRDTLG